MLYARLRPAAPHPGSQRAVGHRLPQHAQIAAAAQGRDGVSTPGAACCRTRPTASSPFEYAAKVFEGVNAHRRRPHHPAHPLHQGRRAVARVDGAGRRRRAGPRLDHRHGGVARHRVGDQVALQGNMDPAVLFSSPGGHRTRGEAHPRGLRQGSGARFQPRPRRLPVPPPRSTSMRSWRPSTVTPSGPQKPDPCQAENFRGSDCLFTCCLFSRRFSPHDAPQQSVR